jgi:hypothetical protein
MIVVTGPGRSGTSLLAGLYKELGFDPGGFWNPEVRAGLEQRRIRILNLEVAQALGVSIRERRGGRLVQSADRILRDYGAGAPAGIRRPLRRAVDRVRYVRSKPDLMQFERLGEVAARFGDQMRALATDRQVVKDPRFCFTLSAWLAAGAPVEAVVFTIRPLDAMADSRVRAGMYEPRARSWARNNYAYGSGLLVAAAAEHRVPLVTLRYPDFTEEPEHLFEVLPLPEARTWSEFSAAFDSVFDPSLVGDRR